MYGGIDKGKKRRHKMHSISTFDPSYCTHCGEILSTDGFCMRCDGTTLEEEEQATLPQTNSEQELDFNREDSPEYEPDSITTDPFRDTGTYVEPDLSEDALSKLFGG